jgi:hypothetical protein
VLAIDGIGREVRVSVKSVSTGGVRHDYAIGAAGRRAEETGTRNQLIPTPVE